MLTPTSDPRIRVRVRVRIRVRGVGLGLGFPPKHSSRHGPQRTHQSTAATPHYATQKVGK